MLALLTQEFYANYDFKFKQRGLLPNAKMSVKNNTSGIAKKIKQIPQDLQKVSGEKITENEAWRYITDLIRMT